jgi:hypothetical protein
MAKHCNFLARYCKRRVKGSKGVIFGFTYKHCFRLTAKESVNVYKSPRLLLDTSFQGAIKKKGEPRARLGS